MKTNGEARFPPTQISSSKRYCIDKIEQFVNERPGEVKILDLGCGEALNFVSLLRRHPQVAYIGVDPNRGSCLKAESHLKGLNATIINAYSLCSVHYPNIR